MYHYAITRTLDDDESHSAYFSVSNYDPVNCAHMLAAGLNTMEANMSPGWALGVVNVEAGTVQYHGKIEEIKRDKPWYSEQTFTFNPSAGDADTILTLFGKGETSTFQAEGKFSFAETSKYAHISRDVLEAAYTELEAVKEVLFEAGVETISADQGVADLRAVLRARDLEIDELRTDNKELHKRDEFEHYTRTSMEYRNYVQNDAARTELIEHVKGAYTKWSRVDPGRQRDDLKSHLRGMIEVLSKYLVAIGEADADERHAVALRVCEIPEGNYLYGDD